MFPLLSPGSTNPPRGLRGSLRHVPSTQEPPCRRLGAPCEGGRLSRPLVRNRDTQLHGLGVLSRKLDAVLQTSRWRENQAMRSRKPPLQQCAAHGPYRAWRPVCPDCVREQQAGGQGEADTEIHRTRAASRKAPGSPIPYGEFPDGF